ncbi:CRISPR-associated helicase Cas3' [Pedobacter sp. BS3]|uniref:CRISPR-associated helicase Cas3' n=1 Tax=Pedobacter sp. BS3 TaxID=2567937 RepID=UPI0011EE8B6A|nr:CRISPR-associated helicase Cas3' [Pedobacter sp. BS3]TZF81276.1 CRISPR-associated helicase Cas3' [Pedobacter sp. BS3]
MSSCFKSVAEILNGLPALHTFLSNAGSYFAHLPKLNVDIPNETLEEHITLVNQYFVQLVNEHRLEPVIDKLIQSINTSGNPKTANYLKKLFVNTIVFHDYGKINERFQSDKMRNELHRKLIDSDSPIGSTHSALSAYIYLSKHLNEIAFEHKFDPALITACIYLSYSIFKHHSRQFDDDSIYTTGFAELKAKFIFDDVKLFLSKYLNAFGFDINQNIIQMIGKNDWLENQQKLKRDNSFSLYALCRLNFSLLTASDYLATNEYMNSDKEYSAKITDFGTLSKERIEEIYQFVTNADWLNEAEGKKNYNKAVFGKTESYEFQNPQIATGDNLNILRTEMAIEVIRSIRSNADSNLFYIEAPTGGGKTNLSALAVIELLKMHQGKYNKVFYVFPFTTLITQTYKSLKETLGLQENEMVELHSNAGMKVNSEDDDNYGNEKLNYINHLFVNYPFTFLSHIRFFDILKTNEKEANYLLHRLANSIVVIDELQSYNPQHWDKVIYFIKQYADKFNIKFILMSATLPKLDKLNVIKEQAQDFVYLLPEARKKYFTNPNFSGRVTFNFDYFDRTDLELSEIAERLLAESKAYSEKDFGNAKPLGSVYTIIEFIFKKTASEFYNLIKRIDFFDEIFVLSGTILPHRRKYIINFLKNKNNRKKKVLLITTQVVEAGVDIDMDLGFKDRSLIDSDEQLAGRINRNVNKRDCVLFLFNYNKEAIIYGKDKRLELTGKHIKHEQYIDILNNKDFDKLYDIVLNNRNEWNDKTMVENFRDYENKIKSLKFKSVHEDFKLIEQNNISCFVPLSVPIQVDGIFEGQKDSVFSQSELDFLKLYQVFANDENEIEGKKVFDVYLNLIHNKQEFIKQKTEEKILQGIMSKYVFSLFASDKIEKQITHYSDEDKTEYGYKYIEHWREFYDIESGMRDNDFNSNETQFL